jgi:hypothetical protein
MTAASGTSMELASGWPIETVLEAIQSKDRSALVQFLKVRYEKRFFEPIALLEKEAMQGIFWIKEHPDLVDRLA